MRQKLFAFGLMIAVSLAGAAWAFQPIPATPAKEHVVALNATPQIETPTDKSGAAAATTATGRVTSVDLSGRRVTIDLANRSTALGPINTGDQVRVQLENETLMTATGRAWSNTPAPRRLLGLWLLAITGTTVVLRARRPQTI